MELSRSGESPFAQWQRLRVEFQEPDADTVVPHELLPVGPDAVHWLVVGAPVDCSVYRAPDSLPWGRSYVVLRASTAPAAVDLLLVVLR